MRHLAHLMAFRRAIFDAADSFPDDIPAFRACSGWGQIELVSRIVYLSPCSPPESVPKSMLTFYSAMAVVIGFSGSALAINTRATAPFSGWEADAAIIVLNATCRH